MNYLVLQQKGLASILKVVSEGTDITGAFESWALKTGKQILFVDTKMYKLLKAFHMHGSYTNGAWFGYSFEDMRAILTEHLGPCDRVRYEQEVMITAQMKEAKKPETQGIWWGHLASYFTIRTTSFVFYVIWMLFKFVGLMLVFPFILHWMNKHKGK